jgi:hypothetical protein
MSNVHAVERPRGRRLAVIYLVVGVVSAIAAMLVVPLVASASEDGTQTGESTTVGSPDVNDPSMITRGEGSVEERAASEELLENIRSGWVPYGDDAPVAGPPVEGWVSVASDGESIAPDIDRQEHRRPVYAQKGGEMIGYDYSFLGFVPIQVADGPGFDAKDLRVKAFGCDPVGGAAANCVPYDK